MIEHDGENIPTVDPKDPNSIKALYGFTYNLADGEVFLVNEWLINDIPVLVGETVDGLTVDVITFLENVTEVGLTDGTPHCRYRVTNRTKTNLRDIDDRSFYVKIKSL